MLRALVLALFVAMCGVSGARADDPPACAGADLFERLKQRDPARHAAIEAEARAIENSQGVLWRVEKPGVKISYLFGTMHVTDRRVLANAARLGPVLAEMRTLAVEIATPRGFEPPASSILGLAVDPAARTISRIADAPLRQKLVEALKERGITLEAGDKMRPWFVALLLSMPGCEMRRQAARLDVLDRLIETGFARKSGRIVGLETTEEQLSAMASLPEAVVTAMIEQIAALGPVRDDIFETLIRVYLDGNVSKFIVGAGKNGIIGESDLTGLASFQQILIEKRNLTMRDRALPLLARGETMVAVGALHLPGPKGLVSLVRQAGYRVTPVW